MKKLMIIGAGVVLLAIAGIAVSQQQPTYPTYESKKMPVQIENLTHTLLVDHVPSRTGRQKWAGPVDDGQPEGVQRSDLRRQSAGSGQHLVRRALVECIMLAAVDRFLGGEALDFFGELGRCAFAECPHTFDEIRFADRERCRQRSPAAWLP